MSAGSINDISHGYPLCASAPCLGSKDRPIYGHRHHFFWQINGPTHHIRLLFLDGPTWALLSHMTLLHVGFYKANVYFLQHYSMWPDLGENFMGSLVGLSGTPQGLACEHLGRTEPEHNNGLRH